MKIFTVTCFFLISISSSYSQIHKIVNKFSKINKEDLTPLERKEIKTLLESLELYQDFEHEEAKLNGKAKFGFTGNESELNNIYKINTGVEIDHGIFPYELDYKSFFQTIIKNGVSAESVSDIDISLDVHPISKDGLWLENFVFINRFNNTYLGIEHRYEIGTGIVLNFFSKNYITKKGKKNADKLSKLPEYKSVNGEVWRHYLDRSSKISEEGSKFNLSEKETETLSEIRNNYTNANIKKYSKLRIALLLGIYYENEKAKIEDKLLFNGEDSLFTAEFEPTGKLKWEVRPTIVWKPNDTYIIKLYPYFKLPFIKYYDKVEYNEDIFDKRIDKFYDIQTSITIKISKKASIGIRYRYLYDFAPKRKYVLNDAGEPVLISSSVENSFYNIDFSFSF